STSTSTSTSTSSKPAANSAQATMRCSHTHSYQCTVCGAYFETASEVNDHVRAQHFYPDL
ncbi:hypothetical protein GQ54DRAFT_243336, partial [Martensiomyces pterosporus]